MTTSLEKPISSSAPAPALVSEIAALHTEIIQSARSTLDRAIRIGQLLTTQKATLAHGQWLPWQKDNLPFNQTTASNYMRLFSNRGKLATIANLELTDAYRLLAGAEAPPIRPARRPGTINVESATTPGEFSGAVSKPRPVYPQATIVGFAPGVTASDLAQPSADFQAPVLESFRKWLRRFAAADLPKVRNTLRRELATSEDQDA